MKIWSCMKHMPKYLKKKINMIKMIALIIFIKICTFCHVNNLRQIKNQIRFGILIKFPSQRKKIIEIGPETAKLCFN